MSVSLVFGQNYPSQRHMIANVCPSLKLSAFRYENYIDQSVTRHRNSFAWENTGQKEIIAFEVVVLKFDPFNRAMIGTYGIIPGHSKYYPLKPGETDSNELIGIGSESVYTSYAFVRNVRFADHTLWTADLREVLASIKKQTPDIVELPLIPAKSKEEQSGGRELRTSETGLPGGTPRDGN